MATNFTACTFSALLLLCCIDLTLAVELRKVAEHNITSIDRFLDGKVNNASVYRVQTNRTEIYKKPNSNTDFQQLLEGSGTSFTRIKNAGELGFHAYDDSNNASTKNTLFGQYGNKQDQQFMPSRQYENVSLAIGNQYDGAGVLSESGQYKNAQNFTAEYADGQRIKGGKYGQHSFVQEKYSESSATRPISQYGDVQKTFANKYGNTSRDVVQEQYNESRLKPSNQYADIREIGNTYAQVGSIQPSKQCDSSSLAGSRRQYDNSQLKTASGQYANRGVIHSAQYNDSAKQLHVTNQYDEKPGLHLREQYNEIQRIGFNQYDKNSKVKTIYDSNEKNNVRHKILLGEQKLSEQLSDTQGGKQIAQTHGAGSQLQQQSQENVQIREQSGVDTEIAQRHRGVLELAEQNRKRQELRQQSEHGGARIAQLHDADKLHLQELKQKGMHVTQQNAGSASELQQQHAANTLSLQQQKAGATAQLQQQSGVGVELQEQNRQRVQLKPQHEIASELQQQSKDSAKLSQEHLGGTELQQQNQRFNQLAQRSQGGFKVKELNNNAGQQIAQQNRASNELQQQNAEGSKLAQAHAGEKSRLEEQSILSQSSLLNQTTSRQQSVIGVEQYGSNTGSIRQQYGKNQDALVVADVLTPLTGNYSASSGDVILQQNSTTFVTRRNGSSNQRNAENEATLLAKRNLELLKQNKPKIFST